MPYPLRDKDPELFRLITIRTDEARLWMIPSAKLEKLLGGIVARYQEILQIQIFAFCFLSNHFHLLIRAPLGNTDEFCENVNREIARRLNWKHHRQGKFWRRRYDDQKIVTEEDLLEAYLYVTTNAVRHGLVSHPALWPGLSSYGHSIESPRSYTFHHYSQEEPERRVQEHKLVISPLPQFEGLKKKERILRIDALVTERTEKIVEERKSKSLGFLGVDGVKEQIPGTIPQNVSRSPRPHCYSKIIEVIKEMRLLARMRRYLYREASIRYRLGETDVIFPSHSFLPPLHRLPRLKPFQILSMDFFKSDFQVA